MQIINLKLVRGTVQPVLSHHFDSDLGFILLIYSPQFKIAFKMICCGYSHYFKRYF